MYLIDTVVLWIHLFSAVLFVGGSFFMWLVVMPASHLITDDESQRTQIVGKIAKQFGRMTNMTLVVLILTGIYNSTWYVQSFGVLFDTYAGELLVTKTIIVAVLLVLIYMHNVYFGRKIMKLAKERRLEELNAVRKRSRFVSAANLVLMAVILLVSTMMQMPL